MGTGEQGYEDQPAHEVQTCCTGELGYGTRMDELYANTPSLSCIKLAMLYAAQKGKGRKLMTLDVKGAFLCGAALRKSTLSYPVRTLSMRVTRSGFSAKLSWFPTMRVAAVRVYPRRKRDSVGDTC